MAACTNVDGCTQIRWAVTDRHTWNTTSLLVNATQRSCDAGEQEYPREDSLHDIEVVVFE